MTKDAYAQLASEFNSNGEIDEPKNNHKLNKEETNHFQILATSN